MKNRLKLYQRLFKYSFFKCILELVNPGVNYSVRTLGKQIFRTEVIN